ncbi:MAG: aminoacyl-tRNA hydrolase [Caldilineaceae bacterium]|nr:aminoacyl-tRNA hydrolase [Caldilineaceae bacterium]HRJ42159.1 alternative ribosome rescue aminoacyl-tRNA hydrolase ArfB [Caldilineaceae bacterium]
MLTITSRISIPLGEIELDAVRSQGAGGQNVNKTATAVQLRFDIAASSLPAEVKERLLALSDQRITGDGVVVLRAQEARSQERNRQAALARLAALVRSVAVPKRARRATRPTLASKRRRLEQKKQRGTLKSSRRGSSGWDGA